MRKPEPVDIIEEMRALLERATPSTCAMGRESMARRGGWRSLTSDAWWS